jgi:Domain of unknown function (DUF4384)
MLACPRGIRIGRTLILVTLGLSFSVGDAEYSRGDVQVLGEPFSSPASKPPAIDKLPSKPEQQERHPLLTPASPSPSLDTPLTGKSDNPSLPSVSPTEETPAGASPENSENTDNRIDYSGDAKVVDQLNSEVQSNQIKIPNSAGLSLQVLSASVVRLGDALSFRISSKKPGYLILIDVDAAGKLAQIYPSAISIVEQGAEESANRLEPSNVLQVPDPNSPQTAFELVASAPTGVALVVAMLSDRPVQLVDLPDVPASLQGGAGMVDYLTKLASELRIAKNGGKDLDPMHWSFDAKFYSIR